MKRYLLFVLSFFVMMSYSHISWSKKNYRQYYTQTGILLKRTVSDDVQVNETYVTYKLLQITKKKGKVNRKYILITLIGKPKRNKYWIGGKYTIVYYFKKGNMYLYKETFHPFKKRSL